MAVIVSFMRPGGLGSIHAVGIGHCRVTEALALDGTTTAAALDGEIAILVNTEADAVLAANGDTPNATATAFTNDTSAGYAIPAGTMIPVALKAGDKINVKAIV